MQPVYNFLTRFWRRRRLALFTRFLQTRGGKDILDVGGGPDFYFWENLPPAGFKIVCVNLPPAYHNSRWHHRGNTVAVVWARAEHLPFDKNSFSVSFSNSVIEHLGSWERQILFAKEILRVGKNVWVQTPAFECPIEPHFIMPFFHWLPLDWRKLLARNFTPWGLLKRPTLAESHQLVSEVRLLNKKEMRVLFPGCRIHTEKLFWIFPKSYIAATQE